MPGPDLLNLPKPKPKATGHFSCVHIVQSGQRQMRMLPQHALAMRVEFFGDDADGLLLDVVGIGEREGIEAERFNEPRSVL